jgi:hypothetical protein
MSPITAVITDDVDAMDFNHPDALRPPFPADVRPIANQRGPVGSAPLKTEEPLLSASAQEQEPLQRLRMMRRPYLVPRAADARFRALHQFEGTVLEIGEEDFVARTRDLTTPLYADEQVNLPLDDVPPSDRELLKVGAVFYWLIGYEENDEGSRKRTSVLRFRRLPAWSGRAVARVNAAAEDLMRRFGAR